VLFLTVGHPSSGKTTWAARWRKKLGVIVLEREFLRMGVYGDPRFLSEETDKVISACILAATETALRQGLIVVCTDRNLSVPKREQLTRIADKAGKATILVDFLTVTEPECLRFDAGRRNPVGSKVIAKSFKAFPTRRTREIAGIATHPFLSPEDADIAIANLRQGV